MLLNQSVILMASCRGFTMANGQCLLTWISARCGQVQRGMPLYLLGTSGCASPRCSPTVPGAEGMWVSSSCPDAATARPQATWNKLSFWWQ